MNYLNELIELGILKSYKYEKQNPAIEGDADKLHLEFTEKEITIFP